MMNPCFGLLLIFAALAVIIWTFNKVSIGYRRELLLSLVLLVASLYLSYYITANFFCPEHLQKPSKSDDFLSIYSLVFASIAMYFSTFFVFAGVKQALKAKEEQAKREQSYADDLKELQDALSAMQKDIDAIKHNQLTEKQSRRPFLCRLLSCLCNE